MTNRRMRWAGALACCTALISSACDSSAALAGPDDSRAGDEVHEASDAFVDGSDGADAAVGPDADGPTDDGDVFGDVAFEFWGPLPDGCEDVFPPGSVRCDESLCPEEWTLCCGTYLCGDMTTFVRGCCADEACGTGGEPATYSCGEAGRVSSVVPSCLGTTGTHCPLERPHCCQPSSGSVWLCVEHSLGHGWNCVR